MGRLKKDHTGWRTSGLWLKYKFPTINEYLPRLKRKKDTKKWCKGKKGIKHSYKLMIPKNDTAVLMGYRKVPICTNCGRQDYKGTVYLNKKTGLYEKGYSWD